MSDCWRYVCTLLLLAATAACSSTKVPCGGKIFPQGIGDDALAIVNKARVESKAFCAASEAGCDYTVAKAKGGWSVAVTLVFPVDGKCGSRFGDEKFYSYDDSGELARVIEGL